MPRWEHVTYSLCRYPMWKVWRISEINDVAQKNWMKTEGHSSLAVFCDKISEEGWELVSSYYSDNSTKVTLIFKRLLD